ncbi:hypothetical protein KCMC57_up57050 [Kitasatospora sp. CMC57]|uniref:Uncharacterized protein n=1 Tax=Kitasatospora sp. CMC57 TaxID=3231513 RepID=A0AB33K1B6_9ACTN
MVGASDVRAPRRARDETGLTNGVVMVPFCRIPQEADQVLAVMKEEGLTRGDEGPADPRDGLAPDDPGFTDLLVQAGIDSVSVTPTASPPSSSTSPRQRTSFPGQAGRSRPIHRRGPVP